MSSNMQKWEPICKVNGKKIQIIFKPPILVINRQIIHFQKYILWVSQNSLTPYLPVWYMTLPFSSFIDELYPRKNSIDLSMVRTWLYPNACSVVFHIAYAISLGKKTFVIVNIKVFVVINVSPVFMWVVIIETIHVILF